MGMVMEQAYEQSRLLDLSQDAIVVRDPTDHIVYWNRGAERVYGFTREEAMGRVVHAFLHTEFPVPLPEIQAALERDGEWSGELVHARRDGRRIHTLSRWMLDRREDGGRRVLEANTDITERKRTEDALRKSEAQLRAVVEYLPSGLIVADLATRSMRWNLQALHIHGYTGADDDHKDVETLVQSHDLRTLDGEPIPVDEWPLPKLLAGESFRDYEILVTNHRLGWRRVFRYSGVVVPDTDPPIGLLAMDDVSERSRMEVELRESDRRKTEFLAVLSHELRNPLAPIRNALHLLDRTDPASPRGRRAREIATRQVVHLSRLVDDLLDITRIARGKVELERRDIDLGRVARATAGDLCATLRERGVRLEIDVPDVPVPIAADETRIAQVITNLLHNAAKFTPAGGLVTLSVRREDDRAIARVRDTGVGIEPELLEVVFEPFIQANQTLARSEGGLGLGLALVRGIIELHGGRVAARSDGKDRGTEFVIALPLGAAARGGKKMEYEQCSTRPEHHHVLVVDDNQDAAETLAELIGMLGHDVDVAFDGPSALSKAGSTPPDVVFCDIGLPGMDGYDVARALRQGAAETAYLVAVSGYAQPEDVARSRAAGFDCHLAKPASPDAIERALHAADR